MEKYQRKKAYLCCVCGQENNEKHELELEYMGAEEESQRTHEKWLQANEKVEKEMKKKKMMLQTQQRLLDALRAVSKVSYLSTKRFS